MSGAANGSASGVVGARSADCGSGPPPFSIAGNSPPSVEGEPPRPVPATRGGASSNTTSSAAGPDASSPRRVTSAPAGRPATVAMMAPDAVASAGGRLGNRTMHGTLSKPQSSRLMSSRSSMVSSFSSGEPAGDTVAGGCLLVGLAAGVSKPGSLAGPPNGMPPAWFYSFSSTSHDRSGFCGLEALWSRIRTACKATLDL